ncbi:hypothetical protein KJ780_03740 [Candidatus Micrarchaeota archaeon]|nr:hypothetical protein [Candidatus Micrarchaeota archaeon]
MSKTSPSIRNSPRQLVKPIIVRGAVGREEINPFRQTPNCFKAFEANPTIGCDLACVYCSMYAQEKRPSHTPVNVFVDYPEYMEGFIREHLNEKPNSKPVFNFTPKSDAFSPSLIETEVTQKVLEVFLKHQIPFYILTKAGMPSRDVRDLLVDSKHLGHLIISMGLPNDLVPVLEPNAASNEQRMELAKWAIANGIATTGIVAPFMPMHDSDYPMNVMRMFKAVGIGHLSLQLLKLSDACLDRLVGFFGESLREFYNERHNIEWTLPGGKKVTRFYANPEHLKAELFSARKIAKGMGITVSTCKEVCTLIGDQKFNQEASRRGITCVGFMPKGPGQTEVGSTKWGA